MTHHLLTVASFQPLTSRPFLSSYIIPAGCCAWLSTADIYDVFKLVPIHPSQWPLFGFNWASRFVVIRLTFGCRDSLTIFNLLFNALCCIWLNRIKLSAVLHLRNDFLLYLHPFVDGPVRKKRKRNVREGSKRTKDR